MKELMLAGATSNVGKTSLTLALIKAFVDKGLIVQPYKVGPDYVDTSFHSRLCGRPSINLDEYLVPDSDTLRGLYLRAMEGADLAIIEGVMGLYDGLGSDKLYCSSAGLALKLGVPIVLVIDGSGTSTSAAAIVKGFMDLEPRLNIAGVIINKISSKGHYNLLKKAIERYNDIKVLGYLAKDQDASLPSQKKGLVPEDQAQDLLDKVDILAQSLEDSLDLDALLALIENGQDSQALAEEARILLGPFTKIDGQGLTLAYAWDEAFSFYYPDNLRLMEEAGLDLIPFSPIHDKDLPQADGYYLGGGYPLPYAKALETNIRMREAIKEASQAGRPIFAEGEALLYLAESLETDQGTFDMAGIFQGQGQAKDRLVNFGYATMTLEEDTTLAERGRQIKGHEYHYSDFITGEEPIGSLAKYRDGDLVKAWQGGYMKNRTLATFLQIHLYQNPSLLERWIGAMREAK